jgi:ketosteroid isomerase-like protein
LGLFESVGRDAYMDSLRTLWELSADATGEPFRVLAWNGRGQVAAVRVVGTMRDGGAFESLLIRVFVTDGGRIRHFEGFPIDDAERAIARFEELCTELPSAAA